jgi:inward rectifier potassium channel
MLQLLRTQTYRGISGRRFERHGLKRLLWQDLYHLLMTVSWPKLFLGVAVFFAAFNLLFALLYELDANGIASLDPPGYWGRFFFSVETSGTVGYGDMHPRTPYAHALASIETLTGVTMFALMTGIMFARFSRPQARFLFARYAVVHSVDGQRTLVLRAANARHNIVMEANAHLRLLRNDITVEGQTLRRALDLKLRREQHPIFLFGWTLLHVIDEHSPLAHETTESLEASRAFLMLTISGTDETTGQKLMARHVYNPEEVRWDYRFEDILSTDSDGVDHFDYASFHAVKPVGAVPRLVPEPEPEPGTESSKV